MPEAAKSDLGSGVKQRFGRPKINTLLGDMVVPKTKNPPEEVGQRDIPANADHAMADGIIRDFLRGRQFVRRKKTFFTHLKNLRKAMKLEGALKKVAGTDYARKDGNPFASAEVEQLMPHAGKDGPLEPLAENIRSTLPATAGTEDVFKEVLHEFILELGVSITPILQHAGAVFRTASQAVATARAGRGLYKSQDAAKKLAGREEVAVLAAQSMDHLFKAGLARHGTLLTINVAELAASFTLPSISGAPATLARAGINLAFALKSYAEIRAANRVLVDPKGLPQFGLLKDYPLVACYVIYEFKEGLLLNALKEADMAFGPGIDRTQARARLPQEVTRDANTLKQCARFLIYDSPYYLGLPPELKLPAWWKERSFGDNLKNALKKPQKLLNRWKERQELKEALEKLPSGWRVQYVLPAPHYEDAPAPSRALTA